MQVWPGCVAGIAHFAKLGAGVDPLPNRHIHRPHVGVDGVKCLSVVPKIMADRDSHAVWVGDVIRRSAEQSPTSPGHHARTRRQDGRASIGGDIHPGMGDAGGQHGAAVAVIRDRPVDHICRDRAGKVEMIKFAQGQRHRVLRRPPGRNRFQPGCGQAQPEDRCPGRCWVGVNAIGIGAARFWRGRVGSRQVSSREALWVQHGCRCGQMRGGRGCFGRVRPASGQTQAENRQNVYKQQAPGDHGAGVYVGRMVGVEVSVGVAVL